MSIANPSTADASTAAHEGMDQLDIRFMQDFNKANALYVNDQLAECITATRDILDDPACPRYHRMKCLVLLGSALGDWNEANDCWKEAKALWRITRSFHPVGQAAGVDDALNELREELDGLRVILDEADDAPEHLGGEPEEDVDKMVTTHEDRVGPLQAQADQDAEALRIADAKLLGTTEETLRHQDVRKAYGTPGVPFMPEKQGEGAGSRDGKGKDAAGSGSSSTTTELAMRPAKYIPPFKQGHVPLAKRQHDTDQGSAGKGGDEGWKEPAWR